MIRNPISFLNLYWHSRLSLTDACDVSTWNNSEVKGIITREKHVPYKGEIIRPTSAKQLM